MIDKLKEYEMDFTDAVFIEKIEKAYKELELKIKEKTGYDELSNADKIKYECNIVKKYIDDVLGENASKNIFGDSYSFRKHLEVLEYFNEKMQESSTALNNKFSKYSPDRIKK